MQHTHLGHPLLTEKLPELQRELAVAAVKFDHARTAKAAFAAELVGRHTVTLEDRAEYLNLLKAEQTCLLPVPRRRGQNPAPAPNRNGIPASLTAEWHRRPRL